MRMLYCPPLPALWCWRPDNGTSADVIHKTYLRGLWQDRSAFGVIGVAVSFLAWPFILAIIIAVFSFIHAGSARRASARGIVGQIIDQIHFAAIHGLLPPWYYIYELYHADRRPLVAQFIHRHEFKGGGIKLMRAYASSKHNRSTRQLSDKLEFYHACVAADIATPRVYAVIDHGKITWIGAGRGLPGRDLFAKPVAETGGTGAERWLWQGNGTWLDSDDEHCDATELLEHFRRQSYRYPLLIQQRVINDPILARFNCDALATIRALSIWDENETPEVTDMVFRMPAQSGAIVDNFHAGGIAASVDIETGKLGRGTNLGLLEPGHWIDNHPITGARITGFVVPRAAECLAFARRCHDVFRQFPIIGLDIALSEDGYCLIEGNSTSGIEVIQRASRKPLGNARYGDLFALHLGRAWDWHHSAAR